MNIKIKQIKVENLKWNHVIVLRNGMLWPASRCNMNKDTVRKNPRKGEVYLSMPQAENPNDWQEDMFGMDTGWEYSVVFEYGYKLNVLDYRFKSDIPLELNQYI